MSLNHDYTISILAAQKVDDFRAEAAQDRLARIALGPRPAWWRRLAGAPVSSHVDGSGRPQLRPVELHLGRRGVAR